VDDLPSGPIEVLGRTSSERINTMVIGLIKGSQDGRIDMVPEIRQATHELRSYLYANLYPCLPINREIDKAKKIIRELYFHLLDHPTPESSSGDPEDSLERRTVDFIAGMSDQYALQLYANLFFPAGWQD
jgi:dGTPase